MVVLFRSVTFLSLILFPAFANAMHEPYVIEDFEAKVESPFLTQIGYNASALIHIEGQTFNGIDESGEYRPYDWSFVPDSGSIEYFNIPPSLVSRMPTFDELDLTISGWRYWYDESEGLMSAYPADLVLLGEFSGSPIKITTVPIPGAGYLFALCLAGLCVFVRGKYKLRIKSIRVKRFRTTQDLFAF